MGAIVEVSRTLTASLCSSGRAGASSVHGVQVGLSIGDSLAIQYNHIMQWNDFEDALYVLLPR